MFDFFFRNKDKKMPDYTTSEMIKILDYVSGFPEISHIHLQMRFMWVSKRTTDTIHMLENMGVVKKGDDSKNWKVLITRGEFINMMSKLKK